MSRSTYLHGASAGALALVLTSSLAAAQQALPSIDIGAAKPHRVVSSTRHAATTSHGPSHGGSTRHVASTHAPSPGPVTSAPPAATPTRAYPVEGSGDRLTGYKTETATSAKLDAPIIKTPIAVQVVQRETLDDQPAFNINDSIVHNASSLTQLPSDCSSLQNMMIRGFATGSVQIAQVYRNGLLDPNEFCPSSANIQAVEVVKGPASVLYGRSEPGGLVDFVTKQPLETPYYSVTEQAGGFGSTRTFVDATGPLTADKVWLYRVDGEFSRDKSFVNFVNSQRGFGSAAIAYRPTQDFKANLRLEYQDSIAVDTQPNFPAYGNHPAQIPINTYLEDPSFTQSNPNHSMKRYVNFDWSYDLNKDWNVTQRFAYNNSRNMTSNNFFACLNNPPYPDVTGSYAAACSGAFGATSPSLPGTGWNQMLWGADVASSITGNLELKGKFTTGIFEHEGLVGTDHLSFSDVDNFAYASFPTQINIFAPAYGNGGLLGSAVAAGAGTGDPPFSCYFGSASGYQCSTLATIKTQQWQGFYAQDLISFWEDKIHVLLGGRYDFASASTGSASSLFPTVNDALSVAGVPGKYFGNYGVNRDSFFSPRVGVVYQPVKWFSIYGNYTESYGMNNGLTRGTGAQLPSMQAVQWEGGVKAELLDKKLTVTASFFDIEKKNIATEDPADPTGAYYDILNARSRGVELDITGRINDNWSTIANFSHLDARATKGTPMLSLYAAGDPLDLISDAPIAGARLPGVPDNQGNVWVKYDAGGQFKGLTGAIGVSRIGTAYGDYANSFIIPAYTTVRLMGGYRFQVGKTWLTTQINVDNLTDSRYFYGWNPYFSNRFSLTPGAPRSVLGSVRLEF